MAESVSQLYRALAPIQPWLVYLLDSYSGSEKVRFYLLILIQRGSGFYMIGDDQLFLNWGLSSSIGVSLSMTPIMIVIQFLATIASLGWVVSAPIVIRGFQTICCLKFVSKV